MVRLGQEARTSVHFISFDDKTAYRIFCSYDAFILATASDEFKEACEKKDISKGDQEDDQV